MPEALIKKRGGLLRVRTVDVGPNAYRKVYVVRKPGPRGGHTIEGPLIHKKRMAHLAKSG